MRRFAFHAPFRDRIGFTLFEMLVVLIILGLAATVATPLLRPPPDRLRLEAAGRQLIAALQFTRATAIASNHETRLLIDLESKTVSSPADHSINLPQDLGIALVIAEPEKETPKIGGFRFFSNGSSTGGDVVLDLHGQKLQISVNWLSGQAQLDK